MTSNDEPTDLDWVQLHREMKAIPLPETAREKFTRKFTENPFVPFGCAATITALSFGLYSFRVGKNKLSQQMMRWRIVAQGFTIVALVGGVIMASGKKEETLNTDEGKIKMAMIKG